MRGGRAGGKCAPPERAGNGQAAPAMSRAEAGVAHASWASGGGASSRLGSALGLGTVSGGAVLRRNRVRLVRHFWCYSGVVSGVARRNRFCSALGTVRCALRSSSGVPGLWYRGCSRESCGLRSAEVRSVLRWKCAVRVSSDRGDRDETDLLSERPELRLLTNPSWMSAVNRRPQVEEKV